MIRVLAFIVFSKQFCCIKCRRQHLWVIEWRRYSRFTLIERTISNLPKVPRAMFWLSDGLFYFISICKFGSFKNPFATITSLYELYFRFRRFILLVEIKKVNSMNYGSSASSSKPSRWVMLDLIVKMGNICINSNLDPLTKSSSNSRNAEFKDMLPWNISLMIRKIDPISTRVVTSYSMKWGISLWVWCKINGNWGNNLIKISQWRESHCRTSTRK